MNSTRRRLLQGVTTITVGSLAGCTGVLSGDGEETTTSYLLPEASPSVEVEMGVDGTNQYRPDIVHVEVGGSVTWTNVSGNHSATAYHPDNDQPRRIPEGASSWDSEVLIDEGASFTHTFETPGVYDYYCTPHEPLGMVASVVVGNPDPDGQAGLSAPGDDFSGRAADKLESLNERVRSSL